VQEHGDAQPYSSRFWSFLSIERRRTVQPIVDPVQKATALREDEAFQQWHDSSIDKGALCAPFKAPIVRVFEM